MLYKDPTEQLDFTVDWSNWLPEGDTIASAVWTVPTGLTQPTAPTTAPTHATIWLGGGSNGTRYQVVNRITTTGGRVAERTLVLQVRER